MSYFYLANLTGGSRRRFRLVRGELSKAAIRHAQTLMGKSFSGEAAEAAREAWYRHLELETNR